MKTKIFSMFVLSSILILLFTGCSHDINQLENLTVYGSGVIENITPQNERIAIELSASGDTEIGTVLVATDTPIIVDGKAITYADAALSKGQRIEVYMDEQSAQKNQFQEPISADGILLIDNQ